MIEYENGKLICGDCLEVMANMEPESVDMIITSPPYNIGIDYGEGVNDNKTLDQYKHFVLDMIMIMNGVLKQGGRLAINVTNTGRKPYLDLLWLYTHKCGTFGLIPRGHIIWDKGLKNSTAWGSWLSASNPSLMDCHEYIMVYSKGHLEKGYKGRSTIDKDTFVKSVESIWRIKPETRKIEHPVPFPEEIPRRLIQLYTYEGDLVVDPFCGSNTTGLAAYKANRRYIGIDQNIDYIRLGKRRIDDFIQSNTPDMI